ncbi:extracellular serine proteinase-like [Saccoglossus kowalevskii]|uniref:Proprotein convertase subtilisin/kexin type 9-like n=1 Tax=Saccoglossus kowalevskii TaxID=10224 RepID=A0ABM0MME5_SACKO|nr:PREDICTED: proprotein convertase subtilisin/kexin type 9-like [Saccoglossus kowalevskii]
MKLLFLAAIIATVAAYHGPPVPNHLDVLDKISVVCPWDPTLASYDPLIYMAQYTAIYIVGHGLDYFHENHEAPGGLYNTDYLWDFDLPNEGWDTDGMGAAIAGAAAGFYTGVGRNITVVSVRVADDPDYKNIDIMRYEDGVNAVLTDYRNRKISNPTDYRRAVVLLTPYIDTSLADTTTLESLVLAMVNESLTVIAPAGDSYDALSKNCINYFPGNMHAVDGVITVGNAMFTNLGHLNSVPGTCNEIYAPGSDVYTSYYEGSTEPNNHSKYVQVAPSSQFAAALVAGTAAMITSSCPNLSPAEIEQGIIDFASNQASIVKDPVHNSFIGYMLRFPAVGDEYPFCQIP